MKTLTTLLLALFLVVGIQSSAFAWTYYTHDEPYIVTATVPNPNTVTLTANPTSVVLPGMPNTTNLTWTVAGGDVTGCTASSTPGTSWNGPVAFTPGTYNQTILGLTVGTYLFNISCTVDPIGSPNITDSAIVVVTQNTPPPVIAAITAIPPAIAVGQSSNLVWSSSNATSCTGTNFSTGMATGGTLPVSPTTTTTYTVTCTGPGGSATDATIVTVTTTPPGGDGPSVNLSATSPVNAGSSSTLTWTVANATSCQASGAWSGPVSATTGTHTQSSGPLFSFSTFRIQCTNGPDSASDTATASIRGDNGSEDFSLFGNPLFKPLLNGSATFTIGANPINNFASSITLNAQSSTLPRSTMYDFNPSTLSCNGSSCTTSILTVKTTDPINPAYSYPITVLGDGGSINHTTTVTIGSKAKPIFREF